MRTLIIFSLMLLSCSNGTQEDLINQVETGTEQQKEKKDNQKDSDKANSSNEEQCYWQIMKRDTLVAKLIQNGNSITGKLSFDNYQKDGSSGSVKGVIDGDILKLWYSFQSEGMNSVMEVWYKKQGDALLRGIGLVGVKGDTSFFTDMSVITFDQAQKLEKADCTVIPEKYK